jgi:hypothetical protein
MFSNLRLGLFEVVVALILVLCSLAAFGVQDFGAHIVAHRIGISHVDAPPEVHAVLRAAGL